MNIHLKVKIKSLAAEARIIRAEEKKAKRRPGTRPLINGLHSHRVLSVRKESRASGLAYGFLRGVPYKAIEQKCHREPDWERVEKLAIRFGDASDQDVKQRFEEWKTAA